MSGNKRAPNGNICKQGQPNDIASPPKTTCSCADAASPAPPVLETSPAHDRLSLPQTHSLEPQGFPSTSRKRPRPSHDGTEVSENQILKRARPSKLPSLRDDPDEADPIAYWASEGHWPRRYTEPTLDMERMLSRKKSSASLSSRKRAATGSPSAVTPSDQRPREEKSAPYRNVRYELLLRTKGTYMGKSALGITDTSKRLIHELLNGQQTVPKETIFDEITFDNAWYKLQGKNEARVIQDISRLIVPSAETLALRNKALEPLAESVNGGWNNSVPLTGTRPQPDYSVGFQREAFTKDQLEKLSPFIGDFIAGDQSFFMGTYYMYFPFLTCEVKCGAAGLDVADRQNAHSMTLAVRGIAELFHLVKREDEVNRQILAFSISHDDRTIRIYGHYPVIANDIEYYHHPIYQIDLATLDGKDRWAAYRFTKNVYENWMPQHLERIRTAINQLPSGVNFNVSLAGTGLSQSSEPWPTINCC
ncbi:hypothetical protein OCS_02133 [Ophiocordyceps sinensis CO18]|uniref:DUF7924 domain-containing protein n=1 Tax=Ophiocordyceps sinensis (strain Co18 / CGMCC 3.14243) TaxID=911162 RepID=T5A9M9_OPHSC|nr:hypothetical protein OCS_02133 [Ophiocordyceps sinensis CO18]